MPVKGRGGNGSRFQAQKEDEEVISDQDQGSVSRQP